MNNWLKSAIKMRKVNDEKKIEQKKWKNRNKMKSS